MDDGRVSYKEAVEAIRKFGYLGVERDEEVEILYADNVPFAAVKKEKQITEPRNYPAEFTGVYNTNPQKKEPWPYRLVAFLNRCLEILLNSILDDFT